jgi:hypothetical protein
MRHLNTVFKIFSIALGVALLGIQPSARADILGLQIGYPQIAADPGSSCSYSSSAGALTLIGAPTVIYFDSAQTNVSFVGADSVSGAVATVNVSANINSSGTLTGGTFTVIGETYDWNNNGLYFGSPLLTGTIVAYGIAAPGTTDLVDFRIQPTGGSLIAPSYIATGDQIAVRVSLEGSTFNGTFASDWGCTSDKFTVGPTPAEVVPPAEQCALSLTKTANPTTIGPILDKPGRDKSGDTDDNDDKDDDGTGYSLDDHDSSIVCGCRGKVSQLTLQYNGSQTAAVKVNRKAPYSVELYSGTVQPGAQFTVSASNYGPSGIAGTLGSTIGIAVNGGDEVAIDTSGAKDIGPGLVAGDFTVVSGNSRKLHKPLCPMPGNSCPANQQVTYTYVLTNGGSALSNVTLDDDKLGNILTGGSLASSQSTTFTKTVCLSKTTTNTATAMGTLPSGTSCAAAPASATVTLLMPPPDCNKHAHDCDPEVTPPPPPPSQGCSSSYWDGHKSKWGKSFKNGDRFSAIFQVDSAGNRSLSDTLDIAGGGSKEFGREAVAALLNSSNPNIAYNYTPAQVKAIVKNAYDTKDFSTATSQLKQYNNCSCPLGN